MSWEKVRLNEILDLQNGYAFNSNDYVEKSNTFNCRMSNIRPGGYFDIDYNHRFLPDNYAEKYAQFLLKDGDLIVAMTDLANDPKILGVPTIVKTKGENILLNQRVGKLVVKDYKKVFIPFLQYILNQKKAQQFYSKFSNGGLQINLGKNDLLSYEIPLPPLHIQKQIANILDKADALRKKDQQLLQKYDELAQSIFIDMFGDPVKNEKGWDLISLGETFKDGVKCGPFGSALKKNEYTATGIPVWIMDNIVDFNFKENGCLFINQEKYSELKSYKVSNGDIIISRAGTVGKMCVVNSNHSDSIISTNLIRLSLDENKLLPDYFVFLMKYFSNKVGRLKKGNEGAFTHMNTGILTNLKIFLPPIELQYQFKSAYNFTIFSKTLLSNSPEHLFQSLLQKAFTGELIHD